MLLLPGAITFLLATVGAPEASNILEPLQVILYEGPWAPVLLYHCLGLEWVLPGNVPFQMWKVQLMEWFTMERNPCTGLDRPTVTHPLELPHAHRFRSRQNLPSFLLLMTIQTSKLRGGGHTGAC